MGEESARFHRVQVPGTHVCPEFDHEVGRVNVILGSNGTGKTNLLKGLDAPLAQTLTDRGASRISKVDGNRVLLTTGQSSRPRNEAAQSISYIQNLFATEQYDQSQLIRFADSVLEALCQDHSRVGLEHSDKCDEMASEGVAVEIPKREESKLDRFLSLWGRIFPDISLDFDVSKVSVTCSKNGRDYQPNDLSTGEKQVFLLLGKFFVDDVPEIFLVDEPDRNLNPRLAEAFWSTIEDSHHDDSLFIYATHSPSFALRPGVDRVFLLDGKRSLEVDGAEGFLNLPPQYREEFLGAIPSFVTRDKVLVVEGEDDGIDRPVYEYLLGDGADIEVIPLRDSSSVKQAVEGVTPWHRITSGITISGVVDRDYRPGQTLDELESNRLLILPFHEAESILCCPEILELAAASKFAEDNRPSLDQLLDRYLAIAMSNSLATAMRRTNERLKARLSLSTVSAEEMSKLKDDAEAKAKLAGKREALSEYVSNMDHEQVFEEEIQRIRKAIAKRDIEELLVLIEGKSLVEAACGFMKVRDSLALLKELKHHVPDVGVVPAFGNLRKQLLAVF